MLFVDFVCALGGKLVGFDFGLASSCPPHHPAAFVLSCSFQVKHTTFFELVKGSIPEMEMEYLALARKEVVFNVEPIHGFKVAAKHGGGDDVGDFGGFVVTFLDG